jgi:RNA polymerase sigma-70 factor (ECF subfamily)
MLDPVTPSRLDSHALLVRRAAGSSGGTDSLPDLLLIERARGADEAAIEALVRRYARRLFRVAHSVITDVARADALVQESYLAAFADLSRYEPTGKFAAWLTRLTYQHARLQRAGMRFSGPASTPAAAPEESGADAAQRAELEQLIGRLPEVFRTVFVLRVLEGISGIETAACLGVHETTVRTRLYRAHRRLNEETVRRVRATPALLDLTPARLEHLVSRVLAHLPRAAVQSGAAPAP